MERQDQRDATAQAEPEQRERADPRDVPAGRLAPPVKIRNAPLPEELPPEQRARTQWPTRREAERQGPELAEE